MSAVFIPHINSHFGELSNPRVSRTKAYDLVDLVILCICGADNWVFIAKFVQCKQD